MGGLRKKIPWTYATMFAATLAIAGIPFFSGFFSKDTILAAAAIGPHPHRILWTLGLAGALLTSFYMFRLLFLTFHGQPRYDEQTVHVHESPSSMIGPLVILAIFSVGGGWWALPKLFGGRDYFSDFLSPVFSASQRLMAATQGAGVAEEVGTNFATDLLRVFWQPAVAAALLGLLIAWWFYIARPDTPRRLADAMRGPYKLLLHKYYVDEIYGAVIVSPLLWISRNVLWHTVDERVLDGMVNGTGSAARAAGGQLRRLQSGNARSYATWVVIGAVAVLTLFIWTMVRQ